MGERPTVGAARAFLAANYSVPHRDDTHYVIVAESITGMTVGTCCDGLDEAAGILRSALRELGRKAPPLAPGSPAVIVGRDDLKAALLAAGALPVDILSRLRAALGEDAGKAARAQPGEASGASPPPLPGMRGLAVPPLPVPVPGCPAGGDELRAPGARESRTMNEIRVSSAMIMPQLRVG